MITLQRVVSSNLKGIGYELVKRELYVMFTSDKWYAYPRVSPETHAALMASSSMGTYFTANVKAVTPDFREMTNETFRFAGDSILALLPGPSFGF